MECDSCDDRSRTSKQQIDAIRQSTFSLSKFKVVVTPVGTGTAHNQTFDIQFTAPGDSNVADITVTTTGLMASAATGLSQRDDLQDGQSGGGLNSLETVIAPNADSTLYFRQRSHQHAVGCCEAGFGSRRAAGFRRTDD